MINVSVQDFDKQLKKQINKNGAWQKVFNVYKNLPPTTVARLQENLYDFPGVDLI